MNDTYLKQLDDPSALPTSQKRYDMPNLNMYLNEKEVQEVETLNQRSNTARKRSQDQQDPLNMNLRNIVRIWAQSNMEIFIEMVQLFSTMGVRYGKYFDEVDNTAQWYRGIQSMVRDMYQVATKKGRAIYIGVTMVILSFGFYLIDSSS